MRGRGRERDSSDKKSDKKSKAGESMTVMLNQIPKTSAMFQIYAERPDRFHLFIYIFVH